MTWLVVEIFWLECSVLRLLLEKGHASMAASGLNLCMKDFVYGFDDDVVSLEVEVCIQCSL